MKRLTSILATLSSSLLIAASSACAADAPTPDAQTAGKQAITAWIDGIRAAKSLSADMSAEVAVKKDGMVVESDVSECRFAVERPNHFALVLTKGQGVSVVNGEKLYEFHSGAGRYQMGEARATIADALSSKVLPYANFSQGIGLLVEALSADPTDKVFEMFSSVALVGEEEVGGVKAKKVRVVREQMPTDYWFAVDSSRLLKFAPDLMTGLAAKGRTPPPGVELAVTITFKNWSYDAAAAGAFAITPPSDAELVDDLFAEPPHPILGKQSPKFETTSLDGKPVRLEDLAGKVVMLDFWATWCGPCVAALPKISATAKKYEDKGVVFYAVNQQEEPSIIKEFLAAQKLNVPVALDLEGKLGAAFAVEGIPQTVIIDKNGKVQVVHVGAGENIGEELAKELDAVLAGKDLAGDKTKKQEAK